MDAGPILCSLIELGVSLALGILVPFLAFRLFPRFTHGIEETGELKLNNLAVGILLGSLILSTGIIVHEALAPASGGFQSSFYNGITWGGALSAAGWTLLYALVVTFMSILAVWVSARLFMALTHELDELEEIQKGNLAVAVSLACTLLVISSFLAYGGRALLASFPIAR